LVKALIKAGTPLVSVLVSGVIVHKLLDAGPEESEHIGKVSITAVTCFEVDPMLVCYCCVTFQLTGW